MVSDKNRVTLQLIFFIMFGNLFLNAHLLLSNNPNKVYVILALIVLYITSVCALIWIGSRVDDGQLVKSTSADGTTITIATDSSKPVIEIENAFNDEPIIVTHMEDNEFVRLKSNGRKYSKLRGHVSKQTRARQPWVGARKAERSGCYRIESGGL